MEKTPSAVAGAAIEKALSEIAPRWKADTIKAFVEAAEQEHSNVMARLADPDEAAMKRWFDNKLAPFRFVVRSPADIERTEHDYKTSTFKKWRDAAKTGDVLCDKKRAREVGASTFKYAYDDFVSRGANKIAEVFGPGAELTVTCKLTYRPGGAIEGVAEATDPARGTLTVHVSVMTNYRYGENAADGVLTVYGQYPMLVRSVVDSKGVYSEGQISLEQAAIMISGRNPVEQKRLAKQALQEKKQKRNEALWALEKIKRAYDKIASQYRFDEAYEHHTEENLARVKEELAKVCANVGITLPESKKAANAKIREIREQIKALKASPL